jgi:hypothetical protein
MNGGRLASAEGLSKTPHCVEEEVNNKTPHCVEEEVTARLRTASRRR